MVSNTGTVFPSSSVAEAAGAVLRKNTVAALTSVEIAPDAILTFVAVNVENPELASCDQRTCEVRAEETPDPIESTHACVALTLSERPCVVGLMVPTLTVEAARRCEKLILFICHAFTLVAACVESFASCRGIAPGWPLGHVSRQAFDRRAD